MMAENKDKLRNIMGNFEEYSDGKRLEMNARKTKIIKFR